MVAVRLPDRPLPAVIAAALLLGSAAALLLTWLLGADEVVSNGARVFFIALWAYLAWSAYHGGGWVRTAILAIFVVTAWSAFNAPSLGEALRTMPAGDQLARGLALAALAAMFTPPAHRWFSAAKQIRAEAAG